MSRFSLSVFVCASLCLPTLVADDSYRLQEQFTAGLQYHVQTRVDISGKLQPPAMMAKEPPPAITVSGESAIDYSEKILAVDKDGMPNRTARLFSRMDFERTIGKEKQQSSLRQAVRRLVVLRQETTEVAFSPDGPLIWGELDLIRTDVFGPALSGLLPGKDAKVGDKWKATLAVVRELTDMEQIEEGELECKFVRIDTLDRRRYAHVSFSGVVSGTNEDGPSKQQLDGVLYFDLESAHISYLSLVGKQVLLREGKEVGRVEGKFTMTRKANHKNNDLSDEALKGIKLEPDAENTRMLYDNSELGVKFVFPRRWRMAGVQGRQIALDSPDGSGLLITLDPVAKVPTGAQFLAETKDWLTKQKATISGTTQPQRVQDRPHVIEMFGLDAEINKEKVALLYYVSAQTNGGATVAARLLPDSKSVLAKEVEAITRSLEITRVITAPKPEKKP